MVDTVAAVAVLLLALGVVGSVLPILPGALLSLAGVYVYWWGTGFESPGTVVLAAFTVVGAAAVAVDYLGAAVSSRVGGASLAASAAAAVAGFVLFFVLGPLGVLVGVAGAVFLVEYHRRRDARRGARAALFATVGLLASGAVQLALTASMLVAFVLLVIV